MNLKNCLKMFEMRLSKTSDFFFEIERTIIMENDVHVCNSCGKAAKDTGHLCDPVKLKEAHVCEHCGLANEDPRHICKPKLQHINFVCIACGRVAELPKQLCNPRDIVLMAKGEPPTKIF
ncbi:MAG: hypothetical protein R6W88_09475 [Desulfobacterales bacterium]